MLFKKTLKFTFYNLIKDRLFIISITIAFLAISVFLASILNIWVDEAYTLYTTDQGVCGALRRWEFERQAPLYFILVALIRTLCSSHVCGRLLSVVSVVGFLWLMNKLAKKLFPKVRSELLILVLAFNPYSLWAASELRPYALALFCSVLFITIQLVENPFSSKKGYTYSLFLLGAIGAIGLYVHYYIGIVIFSALAASMIIKQNRNIFKIIICAAITIILFAPLLIKMIGQIKMLSEEGIDISILYSLRIVYGRLLQLIIPFIKLLPTKMQSIPGYILTLTFVVWIVVHRKNIRRIHLLIWILCLITAIIYLFVGYIAGPESIEYRHVFPLFLAAGLVLFTLIDLPKIDRVRKTMLIIICVVLTGNNIWVNYHTYRPLAKMGDYERVASFVSSQSEAHEPVVLFNAEAVLPFSYYFSGENKLAVIPHPLKFDELYYSDFRIQNSAEIEEKLRLNGKLPKTIWFVDNLISHYAGIDYNREVLDKYLQNNYLMIDKWFFYKAEVSKWILSN